MRKSLGVALSTAVFIGAGLAPVAASAATVGPAALASAARPRPLAAKGGSDPPTAVTFAVSTGALTISVPSTAFLGTGTPNMTIVGLLGNVTVIDNRALLNASWTATVASTNFVTGAGTAAETIPAADLAYDTGTITTTGTITATASDATLSSTPQTVVAGTAGSGDNTATWDPSVAVHVPSAAVGGTYTGTISHSVA